MAETKKSRSPPAHPPFVQMITEAIVVLKERTGSSQYAITKFIEEKHQNLPASYKKLLLNHLKKLVAAGKLVKVKNSFKIPAKEKAAVEAVAKPKKSAAAVAKPKVAAAAKPKAKSAGDKPKVKVTAKPKTAAKPKAAAKPAAKAARTLARTSPGKKADVKSKAKKPVAPSRKLKIVKSPVKKPKSVKSPAKKKVQARKAKK